MTTLNKLSITIAVVILVVVENTVQAATLGGRLFSTGGEVSVQVLNSSAGLTSSLNIYSPRVRFIATNREVGKRVQLGSFSIGEELIFGINAGGNIFRTGPGFRNPDGLPHARVNFIAPNVAIVGFEDLFGGGDRDFDDNRFRFSGGISAVPLTPPTLTGVELNGSSSDITIFEGESILARLFATDPDPEAIRFFVDGNMVGIDPNTSGIRSLDADLGSIPDEGIFSYSVQARDTAGLGSNIITRTLNVLNVAPTITSLISPLERISNHTLFDFSATATDPGIHDILTYEWDFDNDGAYDDFIGSSGQWSFTRPGSHLVNLQVSDGDSGYAYSSFIVESVPESSSLLGLLAIGTWGFAKLRLKKNI